MEAPSTKAVSSRRRRALPGGAISMNPPQLVYVLSSVGLLDELGRYALAGDATRSTHTIRDDPELLDTQYRIVHGNLDRHSDAKAT